MVSVSKGIKTVFCANIDAYYVTDEIMAYMLQQHDEVSARLR
jgi:hypothetical protein